MRSAETARRFQSTLPARGATGHLCFTSSSPVFQSTLPARGATAMAWNWKTTRYFNPRSPHGERHNTNYSSRQAISISIHAPRTGSDQKRRLRRQRRKIFQSTLPARGATASDADVRHFAHISIHAPRTGSDIFCKSTPDSFAIFQSTLPARGATPWVFPFWKYPHRHFNPRSPHGERLSFWNK